MAEYMEVVDNREGDESGSIASETRLCHGFSTISGYTFCIRSIYGLVQPLPFRINYSMHWRTSE